jgi:hypothetical protein
LVTPKLPKVLLNIFYKNIELWPKSHFISQPTGLNSYLPWKNTLEKIWLTIIIFDRVADCSPISSSWTSGSPTHEIF